MFAGNFSLLRLSDVAELSIQHRNLSAQPLNVKYLSAWAITYLIYLPWVFIANLGLKSYMNGLKSEQDMDESENGEQLVSFFLSISVKCVIIVPLYRMVKSVEYVHTS